MPPAFMIARVSPVSPSKSATKPWCRSSPRSVFAGKIATVFSAQSGASPPRCAGISPSRLGSPGGRTTKRSGLCTSPRASAASASAITSMHSSIGSSRRTSCSSITRTLMLEEPPDPVSVVGRKCKLARRQHRVEVLGAVRAADRAGDTGTREHPRERERRHVDAARVRLVAQPVEPVEDAVVDEAARTGRDAASSASPRGTTRRAGTCRSASRPDSGPNGTYAIRAAAQSGSTRSSSPRSSSEYGFCSERRAAVREAPPRRPSAS